MKNFVGVLLIVIGLGLILTEGERDEYVDEYVNDENDVEIEVDPDIGEPDDGSTVQLQPILGIMFLLAGAGVLVFAYNENKPVE
ncbi:MAG: hypothetical protein WD491_12280 [Balneolales bacterium]